MSALLESSGDHMNQVRAAMYGWHGVEVMCELHQAEDCALQEEFRPSLPLPRQLLRVEHRPSHSDSPWRNKINV
jgi:hypothetical protein